MIDSSSNSTESSASSTDLLINSNIYMSNNNNNNNNVETFSNNINTNKWSDHSSNYGSADSYYRNFQNSHHQQVQHQFHPPAYWLHAAAATSSVEQSVNSWPSLSNHFSTCSSASSSSSSSSANSTNSNNNSYYQIPQLNTTNLTAPSSSTSTSASSSAANTPQSQSNNHLNLVNNQTDITLNTKLSLINQDNTNPYASNFNMHSQLVNAYQSYTNNFGGLQHIPYNHAHYSHHHHNQQSSTYPPTPPKDINNNLNVGFLGKNKTNDLGSLLTITQALSDSVKNENLNHSPIDNNAEVSSSISPDNSTSSVDSSKKIKSETLSNNINNKKRDIEKVQKEQDEVECDHNNSNENILSDDDEEDFDDDDEEGAEDDQNIDNSESFEESTSISPSNRNSSNNHDWQICNNNYNFNEKLADFEKWPQSSNNKSSSSNLNNNKRKALPGKQQKKSLYTLHFFIFLLLKL